MYYSSYKGNLKLPELGKRDRAIYNVLIALGVALTVGGIVLFLLLILVFQYPLEDPSVAGVRNTASVLGIILYGVIMGLIVNGLLTGRGRKYPIFGAPGVTYGGPEWTPVYPLLMPTRQAPEGVRKLVREGRQIVGIMAAGVLLSAFVFSTCMLSGDFLYRDGSLRVVWGTGWEMAAYQPEDVAEIRVGQSRPSGRGATLKDWRIQLDYTMNDGKEFHFLVVDGEFQKDGEQSRIELLAQLLESYPEGVVKFYDQGMIPRIVFDQGYSPKDQRILEELFGVR